MNDKIRLCAKEFAAALKEAPQVSRYLAAKKNMEDDAPTQELLRVFQQKQRELSDKQLKGIVGASDWTVLRELQIKLVRQPLIKTFSQAQNDAFEHCRALGEDLSGLLGIDFGGIAAPPSSC